MHHFYDLPPGVKLFLKGAVATFAGGAFAVAVAFYSNPAHYTFAHLADLWKMACAGGVTALAAYLAKSPLPQWKWEKTTGLEDRRGK